MGRNYTLVTYRTNNNNNNNNNNKDIGHLQIWNKIKQGVRYLKHFHGFIRNMLNEELDMFEQLKEKKRKEK